MMQSLEPWPTQIAERAMKFKSAVERTRHLENAYQKGLQALRSEDKPHVQAEDTLKLSGSVDVDTALQRIEPNANRWDFGIAYQHVNRKEEVIYWTELHTASDSQVKTVIKKAQWLLGWLRKDGNILAAFERDFIWVSSGPTTFNLSGPQRKQMALAGLIHVGLVLRIKDKRTG